MKHAPREISEHIKNAHKYLAASRKFPSPTNYAIQILMLLISWENIVVADEKLTAWASKTPISGKLHRDHEEKLKGAHNITRTIIRKGETPITEQYSTPRELKMLREMCQFGVSSGTKDIQKLFERHWHTDGFERKLVNKIDWVETHLKLQEDVMNGSL